MASTITVKALSRFAASKQGIIFSVTFVKRTPPHEVREMVCRTGVTKHLKGAGRTYDFESRNLLCVYDMKKQGYRTIPLEGLRSVKIRGRLLEVTHDGTR